MRLKKLSTYACYYGPNRLEDLAKFDLVILQPDHYSSQDIHILQQQNTIPVAYLSVGEEPVTQFCSDWALTDPSNGQVIQNLAWQTTLVDCRSPAWQSYILNQRIPEIIARGFIGLFLDTLDVAAQFPETRWGVIRLIQRIQAVYPNLFFIGNRGFSILDNIIELLDAFVFESFTTYPLNEKTNDYAIWDDQALAWTALQATNLQMKGLKIPLLALDYAAPTDTELCDFARQRAHRYGFLPYITNRALDWLPKSASDKER